MMTADDAVAFLHLLKFEKTGVDTRKMMRTVVHGDEFAQVIALISHKHMTLKLIFWESSLTSSREINIRFKRDFAAGVRAANALVSLTRNERLYDVIQTIAGSRLPSSPGATDTARAMP